MFRGTKVRELSETDFWRGKPRLTKPTLVMFYAPWCPHCQRLKGEWAKLAAMEDESFEVAAVDAERWKAVRDEAYVKAYPSIRLYVDGEVLEYGGSRRDAEAFRAFAQSYFTQDPIVEEFQSEEALTNGKLPAYVLFYAPWCGFCKRMKDTWRHVAHALGRQTIRVGAVNCEAHEDLAKRVNIRSFPTIIAFDRHGRGYVFRGERTTKELLNFVSHERRGLLW